MVKAKLVRVKDEATDMVFMVAKFEEKDRELLRRTGWNLSDNLCMIADVGNRFKGSMCTFGHPSYDIKERTGELDVNSTSIGIATVVRNMEYIDIPDVVDLRKNI